MYDYTIIQTNDRSKVERSKLLSLDMETLDAPTYPLIHQEARFLYVCKGQGSIEVQGRSVELRPGTLLGILPWQISNVTEVIEPLQFYTTIYNLQVFNQMFHLFPEPDGTTIDYIEALEHTPAFYCNDTQKVWMQEYFAKLQEEVGLESILTKEHPRPLSALAAMTMLLTLVIQVVRYKGAVSIEKPAPTTPDLKEVLRYMYCHTGKKMTIESLSRIFHVSERTLRYFIKHTTGMTFYDLLNEMRLGKVSSYLLYTNLTLEEISLAVGFSDASHISKTFSSYVGMPINDYRKTYQKKETLFCMEDCQLGYSLSEYICRNYRTAITPRQVASQFNITVPEMNRLLLIQTSRNYEDFLNYVRINGACRLLLETKSSITDIAIEVGYSNIKTFNRNFFRIKSMTPSDFRKSISLQPTKPGAEAAPEF